ncbi:MAG: DUF3460 family protein [Neisseriaceae bacterium]
MYHYTSEFTQFIEGFLNDQPVEREKRIKNRRRLWESDTASAELAQFRRAECAKQAYTYFPNVQEADESSLFD